MSPFEDDDDHHLVAEINTTPLIDVLLVLLIMVIVTIPVQPQLIDLALPAAAPASATPPLAVTIALDADGTVRWDKEVVEGGADLDARLDGLARRSDPPELRLRAEAMTGYGEVAAVLAAIQRHGIRKFAVVDTARFLEPDASP